MQPKVTGYPVDASMRRRPIKQAVRLRALGGVGLFAGMSKRNLTLIDQLAEQRSVPAGAVIVTEGDQGSDMMIVVEGSAAVTRKGRKLAGLTSGHVFGEMALLDRQPRSATVTAEEPMRMLVINGPTFRKLLAKVPRLTEALLANLSMRLREANAAADF